MSTHPSPQSIPDYPIDVISISKMLANTLHEKIHGKKCHDIQSCLTAAYDIGYKRHKCGKARKHWNLRFASQLRARHQVLKKQTKNKTPEKTIIRNL